MTTVAIELNDAGFLAADERRVLVDSSPGFALLEGKQICVGAEALHQSRLKPRWVHSRFWDQLDSSAMPKPFPRGLSLADVAHTHLTRLWEQLVQQLGSGSSTSVLLAIPGSFSVNQLGLVLGIARACEIPVTGMVDAAVAAVATRPEGSRILHLDALLHRMIWTEMVHDGDLVRRRVEVLETGGLASIRDAWAKRIAKLLVRQTRFDPLHHGRAEQTLYDLLPMWMEELATTGRAVVTLESEGKQHSVELISEGVDTVSGPVTGPVVELARALVGSGDPVTFMVSERASSIPGLVYQLSQVAGTRVVSLEGAAAAKGALEHRSQIETPGSDLVFVVRLPVEIRSPQALDPATPPPVVEKPRSETVSPTHVLFDGVAHAITTEPLWLGTSTSHEDRSLNVGGPMPGLSRRHCALVHRDGSVVVEDHSSYGTYLNDRRVESRAKVGIGDRLRLGSPGVELLMIIVAETDV